ncbi:MAG: BON domain-containing protein [Tannerellaceae bacterium]|nr:BON domain-containing protein [Tannerellaceae bacterium]
MKRTVFIYLCALLAIVTFYACKPNDANLQKDVQSVLVAYPGVNSTVNNGTATLTGTVASDDIKAGAERAVKAVKHIKSVNNNIMVSAPAPITPSSTIVSSDDMLNKTIRTALDDEGYNDVNVMIVDGEVTLTGKVKRDNLQRVMQIANDASPRRVINQLEID